MEVGHIKFEELSKFEQSYILEAYNKLIIEKVFFALREKLNPNVVIGERQYFEERMSRLYPGFIDLDISFKNYLFDVFEKDLNQLSKKNKIKEKTEKIIKGWINEY
jgi:hypothetical protein